MKEADKKRDEETTTGDNPFDDCFFWLSLAAIDFNFFENDKQAMCESDKETEKQ